MSQDYAPGQRLGDYEVLEVLGAGGMGKVYKVRNVISDRIEAMKIILPSLANQKDLADRFLREIKLLGSLNHPNIATLRTALTIDDQLVMIMEYVQGVTLASRLQQGAIALPDAVNYADQVLTALSYAHKLNIIHRDIKPGNMMLTPEGVVKLMDFGLARPAEQAVGMTVTNTTLGSVSYMPPEQVKGETVDARSDLYSLGVSLYEMVTGQLPFQGESGYSLMTAHVQELPKAPVAIRSDIPKTLNDIILIAMAKDPAKRFQSADAFRNALKNVSFPTSAATATPAAAVTAAPNAAGVSTAARAAAAAAGSTNASIAAEPAHAAAAAVSAAEENASVPKNNYRGFYMALGGLLVVGALFAAGIYLPHRIKTHASSTPAAASSPATTNSQPAVAPSVAPASADPAVAPQVPPDVPATGSPANVDFPKEKEPTPEVKPSAALSPQKSPARASSNRISNVRPSEPAASAGAPPLASTPTGQTNAPANAEDASAAAQIEELQHEADQLNSRALAVSQSLDTLRRQQSAQGLGLRGDIVASEQRMKTDLSVAQSALDKQDPVAAKKYLDYANAETERIEKFLGR